MDTQVWCHQKINNLARTMEPTPHQPPSTTTILFSQRPPPLDLSTKCLAATSKEVQRFFSAGVPTITKGATSSTNRLIKKFVASSPESIALDALSHLLSPDFTHPLLPSPTLPVSNNPPIVT
ncbi:hypothetical protein Peur_052170 [Populus x canadensis]